MDSHSQTKGLLYVILQPGLQDQPELGPLIIPYPGYEALSGIEQLFGHHVRSYLAQTAKVQNRREIIGDTTSPKKVAKEGNPLISGQSILVKCCNLARSIWEAYRI